MVEHITTFFTALLGVTLPEVVCVIFALSLAYLLLRLFFGLFGFKTKILDYAFYVVVGYLAISNLVGLVWNFSIS